MTNVEKALELLKNEDFVKKVVACGDQNAVIELFKNNGATLTISELENLGQIMQAAKDNDGELPDELAEKVAGGFDGNQLTAILSAFGSLLSGLAPAIGALIDAFTGKTTPTSDGGATQAGGDSSSQGEQKQEQAQA